MPRYLPAKPKAAEVAVNGTAAPPCPECLELKAEVHRLTTALDDAKVTMGKASEGERLEDMIEREIRQQLIHVRGVGGDYESVNVAKIIETAVKFLAVKNRVPMPASFGTALTPRGGPVHGDD